MRVDGRLTLWSQRLSPSPLEPKFAAAVRAGPGHPALSLNWPVSVLCNCLNNRLSGANTLELSYGLHSGHIGEKKRRAATEERMAAQGPGNSRAGEDRGERVPGRANTKFAQGGVVPIFRQIGKSDSAHTRLFRSVKIVSATDACAPSSMVGGGGCRPLPMRRPFC